jgi:hypothetical protein
VLGAAVGAAEEDDGGGGEEDLFQGPVALCFREAEELGGSGVHGVRCAGVTYLLDKNTTGGVGYEDNRPGSWTQRGAGAGEFDQQFPGMREDVALEAERLLVRDEGVVAPCENPRVWA